MVQHVQQESCGYSWARNRVMVQHVQQESYGYSWVMSRVIAQCDLEI